jgi:tetratricopeptide (TPR) repeat protein
MNVSDAIAKWRGNLGIEVRNAALKREVIQLESEAKKVLVVAAILGEASLAEIKQCLDYSDATLIEATNELQSLFLIHAPPIADQPRFSISSTTRDLVLGLGPEIISEFTSFRERITGRRYMAKGQKIDLRVVGIAINQANALLAARQPEAALRTVDEVNARFGAKNRDLLFMRARVLLKLNPPKSDEARKTLSNAYELGQRKPEFFGIWYDTELLLEHFEAAVDVSTNALDASVGMRSDWLRKRAFARLQSAVVQDKAGDLEHTRTQLRNAADDLASALKIDSALEWDALWRETIFKTHDSLWIISIRGAMSVPEWIDAFETQIDAIRRGDRRVEIYARLQRALTAISELATDRRSARGERGENLLAQRTRWCIDAFREAPRDLKNYHEFRGALEKVEALAKGVLDLA